MDQKPAGSHQLLAVKKYHGAHHVGCPRKQITQSWFDFVSSHDPQDESGDNVKAKVV